MAEISLKQALLQRRTVRDFSDAAVPVQALERLLWAAQGVTGPDGNRTAPSAHAVHPLRLYVQVGRVTGLDQGLYEVGADDHVLRLLHGRDLRPSLAGAAIDEQPWIRQAACIVVICADMVTPGRAFADQRPLGRRGARYVYLEAGAAAQNLQLQAVAEGLGCVGVGGFNDEATADVLELGIPLEPVMQLCIGYPAETD
ncbi:SagB/ThcOx family dehydrogenase [Alcaligenaceae bacterium]|nr:SagB/ThcOx family dehydrogenase [Alcaligenaceae bacterium]